MDNFNILDIYTSCSHHSCRLVKPPVTFRLYGLRKTSSAMLISRKELLGLLSLYHFRSFREGCRSFIAWCWPCAAMRYCMQRISLRLIWEILKVSSCDTKWLGSLEPTSQLLPDLVWLARFQPLPKLLLRGAVNHTIVIRFI
jgi:hypothetical protein